MVRAKDHKSLMVVRVRPTASFFPHSKVFRDEPTRCTTRRKIHGVEDEAIMAPEFSSCGQMPITEWYSITPVIPPKMNGLNIMLINKIRLVSAQKTLCSAPGTQRVF